MKAARLTTASVHHFLDLSVDPSRPVDTTGSADAVFADTAIVSFSLLLLFASALCFCSLLLLFASALCFCSLLLLFASALCLTHVRRTCMSYLYVVQVRCTSLLVRRIVVKAMDTEPRSEEPDGERARLSRS